MFTELLSSNGHLCDASMTAHFLRSGIMSQYQLISKGGVQMSICEQRNLHTDLNSDQTQNRPNGGPTPYLETTTSHSGTQKGRDYNPDITT
jgi:hypothetical protein